MDFWSAVPSYELVINGVPRTVLATNKKEDLKIFLDFTIPIENSTDQILNALQVSRGKLVSIYSSNQGNRRFDFQVSNKFHSVCCFLFTNHFTLDIYDLYIKALWILICSSMLQQELKSSQLNFNPI